MVLVVAGRFIYLVAVAAVAAVVAVVVVVVGFCCCVAVSSSDEFEVGLVGLLLLVEYAWISSSNSFSLIHYSTALTLLASALLVD